MRLQIDAPNQFRQLMLPQLQFARFKNSWCQPRFAALRLMWSTLWDPWREKLWSIDEFDLIGRLKNLKRSFSNPIGCRSPSSTMPSTNCKHLPLFRFQTFRVANDRFVLTRGSDGQHVQSLKTVVYFNTLPYLTNLLKKVRMPSTSSIKRMLQVADSAN